MVMARTCMRGFSKDLSLLSQCFWVARLLGPPLVPGCSKNCLFPGWASFHQQGQLFLTVNHMIEDLKQVLRSGLFSLLCRSMWAASESGKMWAMHNALESSRIQSRVCWWFTIHCLHLITHLGFYGSRCKNNHQAPMQKRKQKKNFNTLKTYPSQMCSCLSHHLFLEDLSLAMFRQIQEAIFQQAMDSTLFLMFFLLLWGEKKRKKKQHTLHVSHQKKILLLSILLVDE